MRFCGGRIWSTAPTASSAWTSSPPPTADGAEFWLLTYWQDEDSFRRWHHSHLYRESHAGIPQGLKLVPEATELLTFRYITD
jgi:heme-degrading monooxygenase HmoA